MKVGIVGAGVFGVASALELRRRGHDVTVFEQGRVPNERASSTDVAKVIRRLGYGANVPGMPSNEAYLELVLRASAQWKQWQNSFESPVYHQVGQIFIGDNFNENNPLYPSWQRMKDAAPEILVLPAKEARARFPQFTYRDADVCVYDPWAGYLESGRALDGMAKLARAQGVAIREDCPVKGVEDTKGGAKVVTADGGFTFDRVVVAAGCWMRRVLPGIGAQVHPTRQQMAFYEVTDADTDLFSEKKLPVWGVDTYKDIEHGYGWYGFPVLREGYVKISNDFRSEQVDPDDHRENTKEFLRLTDEFVKQRMPKLAKARFAGGRSCFYEHTSDWDFLIDRAPGFQRVVVAGGGSGHGFKFGGSIGPVIADTVEEKPNALAAPFRVGKRFATLR